MADDFSKVIVAFGKIAEALAPLTRDEAMRVLDASKIIAQGMNEPELEQGDSTDG